MSRKVDLPEHVYAKRMHCEILPPGVLMIEMPFHLPPQRPQPQGPHIAPIIRDADGQRKIRMAFNVGTEFTPDDIDVQTNGKRLTIAAQYEADIGKYGAQHSQRQMRREFRLPDSLEVDSVHHTLAPDGRLYVEILLRSDLLYKCKVTTEKVDFENPE
jgi:HSP20 family molecular chaperone IbpA